MKTKLLALSLFLGTSGLMAQQDDMQMQNSRDQNSCNYCNSCCTSPCSCSCKPCCVPKPKKCIDCECYVPAYYDLQCAWGASVRAEFLYWYAKETNSSYATQITAVNSNAGSRLFGVPTKYVQLKDKWYPGARVGLGWDTNCDGWDFLLQWTYQHNKSKGHTATTPIATAAFPSAEGEQALVYPFLDPAISAILLSGSNVPYLFDAVRSKWTLNYNQIDLQIGRKYWLSRCFTMRPYTGLRGAWTKTRNVTVGSREPFALGTVTPITYNVQMKDSIVGKNWGVGLLAGFQPSWYICSNFVLFGDFGASLIWGQSHGRRKGFYNVDSSTAGVSSVLLNLATSSSNEHSHRTLSKMSALFDLAIGLGWEETWCCDRYRTSLDLGWEHHIWLDHGTNPIAVNAEAVPSTTPTFFFSQGNVPSPTNLGMGGLVLRARFDF